MKTYKMVLIAAALGAAGSAQAAGIGVRAGTTGLGADVGFGLMPTLSARVGYSAGSWNTTVKQTDIQYDGKVKVSNANAFLDWSPLGPFRITGGFIATGNKVDVHGTPTTGPGSIDGSIKTGKSTAPYLGIGYGNVAGAGINFYADLGAMFMGSPKASLSANCSGLTAGQCTTLQGQVATEQQRLQDSINKYKIFPVLNIGLTIGF